MRITTLATVFAALALPALADETTGIVHHWDAATHRLTLSDRTIWRLPADLIVPADLTTGDRVVILFRHVGDNGVVGIDSLNRSDRALAPGATGGT